jgi:membrane-bound lytic murein transglycosylase A
MFRPAATLLLCCIALQSAPAESAAKLVRLAPDRYPHFMDIGNRETFKDALRTQLDWFTKQDQSLTWSLGDDTVTVARLHETAKRMLDVIGQSPTRNLNKLIRMNFEVYAVAGSTDTARARFTGYHNPVVEARLEPDSIFRYPLYRKPPNPRHTRKEIDQEGVLDGQGYTVAWLRDPLDRYEIHIEGSATLLLRDSTTRTARYAGCNGHSYTSLGRVLIEHGVLPPESTSMDAIRNRLRSEPDRLQHWLNYNESYCFFRLTTDPPPGSLALPLVPERTIAADHRVFPAGALCWFAVRIPGFDSLGLVSGTKPCTRFVLNQDKGAAITGPNRIDIFWGTGSRAAGLAGNLNARGRFYLLLARKEKPD